MAGTIALRCEVHAVFKALVIYAGRGDHRTHDSREHNDVVAHLHMRLGQPREINRVNVFHKYLLRHNSRTRLLSRDLRSALLNTGQEIRAGPERTTCSAAGTGRCAFRTRGIFALNLIWPGMQDARRGKPAVGHAEQPGSTDPFSELRSEDRMVMLRGTWCRLLASSAQRAEPANSYSRALTIQDDDMAARDGGNRGIDAIDGEGDDRRAVGHGVAHGKAERLRPVDGEEQCRGIVEKSPLSESLISPRNSMPGRRRSGSMTASK